MENLQIEDIVNGFINDLKTKWNMSENTEDKRRVLLYYEPHNVRRELKQEFGLGQSQAKYFENRFREAYNPLRWEYSKMVENTNSQLYTKTKEKTSDYTPAIPMTAMAGYEKTP